MKADIHPAYGKVIFIDSATGDEWTTRSTMKSKETREVVGEEVPDHEKWQASLKKR